MRGDNCVENVVVEHVDTWLVIGQVVIRWLIVVVEDDLASASNDSLRRTHHRETVDLVKRAIESLNRRKSPGVPDAKHA